MTQAVFSEMSISHNLDDSVWQALSSAAWKTAKIQMFYDPGDRDRMFCFSAGRKVADVLKIENSEVDVQYYEDAKEDPVARPLLSAKFPVLQWVADKKQTDEEKTDLRNVADKEKTELRSVTMPGASLSTSLRYTLLGGILKTIAEDRAGQYRLKRQKWSQKIDATQGTDQQKSIQIESMKKWEHEQKLQKSEWDNTLAKVKMALRVAQELSGSDTSLPELQVRLHAERLFLLSR